MHSLNLLLRLVWTVASTVASVAFGLDGYVWTVASGRLHV